MEVRDVNSSDFVLECEYVILDQRNSLGREAATHQERFFQFWRSYWTEIHRSVGLEAELDDNEFFRQHKVTALVHGEDVVAMHLLSCFQREQMASEVYFRQFDPKFQTFLETFGSKSFLTLQYLAFAPEWKKIKAKPYIYLPMAIGSLSVLHAEVEGAKAVISVARKDLGISNALAKMNFQPCIEDGVFNNTPVSYQVSRAPRVHPHPEVGSLVEFYWNNRTELNNAMNSTKEVA